MKPICLVFLCFIVFFFYFFVCLGCFAVAKQKTNIKLTHRQQPIYFDDSKFCRFSNDDPWLKYVESKERVKFAFDTMDGCNCFFYFYAVNNYITKENGITITVCLEDNIFAGKKKYDITVTVPRYMSLHADGISIVGAPRGKKCMSTTYLKPMTLVPGLEQFGIFFCDVYVFFVIFVFLYYFFF